MHNKILILQPKIKSKHKPVTMTDINDGIRDDITKFCDNFEGEIDRDRAVQIASDFYNNYPMLIEYVRSDEFLLRRK